MGTFLPCIRESPTTITYSFFLVLLGSLGSASPDASLDTTSSLLSSTSALTLFRRCRSVGGVYYLLVIQVTSFQPLLSQGSLISQPAKNRFSLCLHWYNCRFGLFYLQGLREDPVTLLFVISRAAQDLLLHLLHVATQILH